jgi:hypothetical protein
MGQVVEFRGGKPRRTVEENSNRGDAVESASTVRRGWRPGPEWQWVGNALYALALIGVPFYGIGFALMVIGFCLEPSWRAMLLIREFLVFAGFYAFLKWWPTVRRRD